MSRLLAVRIVRKVSLCGTFGKFEQHSPMGFIPDIPVHLSVGHQLSRNATYKSIFQFFCVIDRDAFRQRDEYGSGLRLALELTDLESKTGKAYKKREEIHKLAEVNRAYSHFLR